MTLRAAFSTKIPAEAKKKKKKLPVHSDKTVIISIYLLPPRKEGERSAGIVALLAGLMDDSHQTWRRRVALSQERKSLNVGTDPFNKAKHCFLNISVGII